VPASVMGQLSNILAWVINATWMHMGDKYAEDAQWDKMTRLTWIGSAVFFIVKFVPIFLSIYFGAPFVAALNENMPPLISRWLNVSKGMLPALGFGMLFSMMYKPKYVPYFIIGFIMTAVFKGSLLAIAALGIAAAMISFFNETSGKKSKKGAK
ncbi:MAG: PTS sugar transporter subunit IIC, partial [Erysipelotrichaceae bacterium]|nr:PTS sugar transporter subunit IIC [Erysipelotrichaceae bacterium]